MTYRITFSSIILMLLIFNSCSSQENTKKTEKTATGITEIENPLKKEPHRYGGWYCPDNFGFTPVDIQKLDKVPAIIGRLPTEQELMENKSLIKVDTDKYPDARALDMDLPRVAYLHSDRTGMNELIIVIQAIVVQNDTVVGYRFVNGGNGSTWMSDVSFLSDDEVAKYGSQPFFFKKAKLKATKEDIWKAMTKTEYFQQLGHKFNKLAFFSSEWNSQSEAHLDLDTKEEKATGYIATVYGNAYLHIDYNRNGVHYSEKMLMIENEEDKSTEFFFSSGPYPNGFTNHNLTWASWFEKVSKESEAQYLKR